MKYFLLNIANNTADPQGKFKELQQKSTQSRKEATGRERKLD